MERTIKISKIVVVVALISLLAACASKSRYGLERDQSVTQASSSSPSSTPRGGGYYQDDGPGDNPPNLQNIPDAVPKVEPLRAANNRPYTVLGRQYTPYTELASYKASGTASWYGRKFHGQRTASGEIYDMYGMTAAHTTLPIPSYVRVTNLNNQKSVIVRVNDRGPFHQGRIIDLSYAAAYKLGFLGPGSTLVDVESINPLNPLNTRSDSQVAATSNQEIISKENNVNTNKAETGAVNATEPLPLALEKEGVYLQLGAFSVRGNAETFKEKISRQLVWLTDMVSLLHRDGLFRVQLGPYRDQLEAITIAEKIREALDLKPTIVTR